MKASDLDDREVLAAVVESCVERNMWTNTTEMAARFSSAPFKVVAAKLARLERRGLLTGCSCGCRGDWELTAAGYAFLGVAPWRDNPIEGIRAQTSVA